MFLESPYVFSMQVYISQFEATYSWNFKDLNACAP